MGSFNPFTNPRPLLSAIVSTNAQSSNFTSNTLNIADLSKYSLQVNITNQSSLSCSIEIEGSLDGTNWSVVPNSSVNFSSNTSYIWDNFGTGIPFIRLAVTFSAGSAMFTMLGYAKL